MTTQRGDLQSGTSQREYRQRTKNQSQQEGAPSAVSMGNEERLSTTAGIVMWLCASMSVSKITTPRKTSKVTLNVFYESRVCNDYVIKI
jgi:hypothetical protein